MNGAIFQTGVPAFMLTTRGFLSVEGELALRNHFERLVYTMSAALVSVDIAVGETDSLSLNINRALFLAH